MRSVHVCATAQHRGAERFALDLVGAMRDRGADAGALALWDGGPPPRLDLPVLGRHPYGLPTLWRLRREVPRTGVAVAHGSSTLAACGAALVGQAPFIYRSIGDPAFWASSRRRRFQVDASLRRAAAVVVMWPAAAEEFRRLYGSSVARVVVIPKGISDDVLPVTSDERAASRARLGITEGTEVVATLGALSPEKDPAAAVRAVASMPSVHLLLIGDGPLQAEVAALAERLLPGRHTMTGVVAEPRSALAAADVLFLPSRTEGVPSAPLEAGLLGIPSVVTRVGGAPSTVDDGRSGIVVQAGDVEDMAAALVRVLPDATSMGRSAREHVRATFDISTTAAAWIELCDEVASSR